MALLALSASSCKGGRTYYPVRGQVFVDGKPAEGVLVVFHLLDDSDPSPVQPSAVAQKDGSFVLQSFPVQDRVLRDGAPAGKYAIACVWYPADLQKYLGRENLPDKLNGKYANPKTSGLSAEVSGETQLPPFKLETRKK